MRIDNLNQSNIQILNDKVKTVLPREHDKSINTLNNKPSIKELIKVSNDVLERNEHLKNGMNKKSLFSAIDISAQGLSVQRTRMNIISENLANVETTKTTDGGPYRRKIVQISSTIPPDGLQDVYKDPKLHMKGTNQIHRPEEPFRYLSERQPEYGVQVQSIIRDPSAFKLVYDPAHPDANIDGYVEMPNVNTVQEMIDLISASRSYEANVTALNSSKEMIRNALKI